MEVQMTNEYTPYGWMFERLSDDVDGEAVRTLVPRADVISDGEGYRFSLEMPGLKAESIDVRFEDRAVVVEAERKRPELPKGSEVHFAERAHGKIRRAFELPDDADQGRIVASYRDGVLEVSVPKRPESRPVKVKVNVEN